MLNAKSGKFDYKTLYDLKDEDVMDHWKKMKGKQHEEKIDIARKMKRQ